MSMAKNVFLMALVLAFTMAATPSHADNTHGTKVKVINDTKPRVRIKVFTWNAKDVFHGSLVSPHKIYHIYYGGERWVKSHGQGKNTLWLSIHKNNDEEEFCADANGWLYEDINQADGHTVTITYCGENNR